MSYTAEEKAERLLEMKRQPFRRCSIDRIGGTMDPPESWVELIEVHIHAEIVDRYLRGFVDPEEKAPCPFCRSTISFSWGLVHGQGNCHCGWPGTLYHYVHDSRPDGDLLCLRENCGKRRDEHVENTVHTEQGEQVELGCPGFKHRFDTFKPPLIVRFTRLLWVHPYDVHMRKV